MRQTIFAAAALSQLFFASAATAEVRLIVQITVDGLRGDLLHRYHDSFGPDGFRRLTEGGVWYLDAHHDHANTETVVGHATLATGAHPAQHGMIGNAWLYKDTGNLGYSVEDPDYAMLPLPLPGLSDALDQVDPAQAAAQSTGRSPVALLTSTFSDELWKSNAGASKVISVSGKDRSAIMLGGHFGTSYWMNAGTGAYETSDYYLDAYPDWVIDWNSARKADAKIGQAWELSAPRDSYLLAGQDDRPYEVDLDGFGRTFPHPYGAPEDGLYYTQILFSPPGDALTADFAKAAVAAEGLGRDAIPDFLSVSFAGVDGSQHFFGPSSLESEELVRSLDRTLSDLFAFLDAEVGEEHILFVLSADHGMPEFPEYMAEQGMETHRTFSEDLVADLDAALSAEFGNLGLLDEFYRPYLYLNDTAIAAAGLQKDDVAEFIVESLKAQPGISMAVPRASLREQEGQAVVQQIRNNLHPVRSGDIYVAPASYSFLFDKGAVALMHGSPWRYDTHVPVIFAGPGIKAQRVARRVSTTDVAVTLAAILGTTQPSGASGSILPEALP